MSMSVSELFDKCRFCLKGKEKVGYLKPISPETEILFYAIAGSNLTNRENLSKVTCSSCSSNLVMYFNFKRRLIETQLQLIRAYNEEQSQIDFILLDELPSDGRFITNLEIKRLPKGFGEVIDKENLTPVEEEIKTPEQQESPEETNASPPPAEPKIKPIVTKVFQEKAKISDSKFKANIVKKR
jgi:hypothetical protein